MPTNDSELLSQARQILDAIAFTPFEECQPLSRGFGNLPARPGIYAKEAIERLAQRLRQAGIYKRADLSESRTL